MYQGWMNEQTWAVALALDNDQELQKRALKIVRDTKYEDGSMLAIMKNCGLRDMVIGVNRREPSRIQAVASWAWPNFKSDIYLVDWTEVRKHYEQKCLEGA